MKNQLEEQKPLVHFAESVKESETCISVAEMAQILKQNKLGNFGQQRFYEWLRFSGYLNIRGARRNLPTQKSIDKGIMRISEYMADDIHICRKTEITGSGQHYFINLFREELEYRKKKGNGLFISFD